MRAAILLCCALAMVACGGGTPSSSGLFGGGGTTSDAGACVPGAQAACACANGTKGAQVCGADDTYGACDCGNPNLPAEVAWSIQMTQSDPVTCKIADNDSIVGGVSDNAITMLVANGSTDANMSTATVACTVAPAAPSGSFTVQGFGTLGAAAAWFSVPQMSVNATSDSPASGFIAFESAATADQMFQGLCDFYFDLSMGSPSPIQPGSAWMAFQCAAVSGAAGTCSIARSYIAFQNCQD